MSSNMQADLARYAEYHREKARKMAAFSRLSRAERERAFSVVRERQGGFAVVRLDDMIRAHEELTGRAI
jgi:hypothetical protein